MDAEDDRTVRWRGASVEHASDVTNHRRMDIKRHPVDIGPEQEDDLESDEQLDGPEGECCQHVARASQRHRHSNPCRTRAVFTPPTPALNQLIVDTRELPTHVL